MIFQTHRADHRSVAVNRSHLMPVVGSVHAALTNPDAGPVWPHIRACLACVLAVVAIVAVWGAFA